MCIEDMALETDRSSPDNASSPGPSPSPATSSSSSFSPSPCSSSSGSHCTSPFPRPLPSPHQGALLSYNFPPRPDQPGPALPFSVDNILRPEFGRRAIEEKQRFEPRTRHHDGHHHHHRRREAEADGEPAATRTAEEHHHHHKAPAETTKPAVPREKVEPAIPKGPLLWPAWVYCTRYSDRPSSGPRSRRMKKKEKKPDEKRPRTAFTQEQLARLKKEFEENRYLTEKRRQDLARDLNLHENQIKIWFQNKRAKIKKATGQKGGLALQLMAQGLYNHSTVPVDEEDMEQN